jgi:hypothetical protein
MLTFNTPGASQPGLARYGPGPDLGPVAAAPFSTTSTAITQTYAGPGDLVAGASGWFGLRAYSAAVAAGGTQKAINIRRTSDSASMEILILPSGDLDVATATTFCNATTCFVTKAYDQSGNGKDATQPTQAAQPQLVFNGLGVRPTLVASGTQWLGTAVPSVSQPLTLSSVSARTGNFTAQGDIIAGANGHFYGATAVVGGYYGASASVAATNSAAHAIQFAIAHLG